MICLTVKLRILGGGREVGRAAYLLEGRERVLFDYGVNFDEKDLPQLPLHVRPVDLDAVVISHAHLDHVGAAPYLFITGKPKIYATRPTLDIARLLTIDFLKLNAAVIEYDMLEFEKMYSSTVFVDYQESVEQGFKLVFTNAGHILGSTMVYLETSTGEKILYTGDVNNISTWTLSGADFLPVGVDTIIMESTYGGRNHPKRHLVEKRFVETVEEVVDKGGTVLIPAFSVGRSQELMTLLTSELPYVDIYIDGMVKDVSEIYLKHRKFLRDPGLFMKTVENVNFVTKASERKKLVSKPCVIIASAGMLKGGPSVYYFKKIAENPRNAVLLVSYQAPASNGHKLLEEGRLPELELNEVKARVEWYDFSSHAGRDGLAEIAEKYKASLKNVILIHGGEDDQEVLKKELAERLGGDVKIVTPKTGDEVVLSP
ncbi:MBL fold metallo-hydrolase [Thermosphaera aggregans]|uniref:MBL fold metallo-hydrolase n=1 Tax=Thermosphaera aggregans TaxID=54254 RepID=UPI000B0C1288